MQALADLLRDAVNRQVLTEDDLYRTESFVIQKLEADPGQRPPVAPVPALLPGGAERGKAGERTLVPDSRQAAVH